MNHPAVLFGATLFTWAVGFYYFRWILRALRFDTKRLVFWIGPFEREWEFPERSLRHRLNSALHWFQMVLAIAIGGPITLFFMLLMPWAFAQSLWQMIYG